MPNKTLISNFNGMEDNENLALDTWSVCTIFKNLFLNLAESLLTKLWNPLDKSYSESVINYYSSFRITDFKILKIKISKAAGIDRLSRCFLWDATHQGLYLKAVTYQYEGFPNVCQVSKLKPI